MLNAKWLICSWININNKLPILYRRNKLTFTKSALPIPTTTMSPLFTCQPLNNFMINSVTHSYLQTINQLINHSLGRLSSRNGNGNKNITWKYHFISFVLLRDYFNSSNFYRNGELSRNQIGRSGVQVKKENEKFTIVCSCSPKNLESGHFTLLFCRGQQRNVPKCKTHVQSDCFCSLNLLLCGVVVVVAVIVA